ncbi:phosphotransferase [Herpetosiphon llansteffanensis]|uniref:phosphotransferase n=1 Tax=Herpetosiphon llansteffanensis TaxID=2094568 RepID=UPI0013DF3A86|nr:phosphotransferase [Herpetosiphon llansteffanensis]
MNPEPIWMVTYRLIIRDVLGSQLFVLPSDNQLRLPTWQLPFSHFWQDVAHINAWVLQHLGLNTRVLRCINIADDFTQHHMTLTYELLAEAPNQLKTGNWLKLEQALTDQVLEPSLRLWQVQRLAQTPHAQAVPWYQPDWGPAAFQWVTTVLAQTDIQPTGQFEHYRTWNRSSVWQLATTHGTLYFKALPAMFGHEIGLTHHLLSHEPNHTAPFLALEQHHNWMLLPDFGAPKLTEISAIEQWQASFAAYAKLQIRQIDLLDQLEACGLAVRPLRWLSQQIEPLLNDSEAVLLNQPWGLSSSELAQLQQAIPQLKAACRALQAYNIPNTLDHGDLGASNIIVKGQHIIVTDWSDASISQPFFSLGLLLEDVEIRFSTLANVREVLLKSYLDPWAEQLRLDYQTLRQAYRYAELLTPIHQALTYQHWIKPYLQASWEMEAMIPTYLRQLILILERSGAA